MQQILSWPLKNREYLILVLVLFAIGVTLGGTVHSQSMDQLMKGSIETLKGIQRTYTQMGSHPWVLAWLIFKNNLFVSFLCFILGAFLAVIPTLLIIENGVSVGYVVAHASVSGKLPMWEVVALGILPHGIFEIPAILLAAGLGLKLGSVWIRPLVGKNRVASFGAVFKEVRYVGPLVIALLLAAALIEGFVTPVLLRLAV